MQLTSIDGIIMAIYFVFVLGVGAVLNINLIWGLVLLAFGSGMLLLERRAMARPAEKITGLPPESQVKRDAAHR